MASIEMATLKALKKLSGKKYKMKNLAKVKIIIGWQVTRDPAAHTMIIDQSAFIRDFVIKEGLTNCNANVIPMKVRSAIKMNNLKITKRLSFENINI